MVLEEVFWYISINTSTTGREVCIVMVKKLCSFCLPGFSWQLVLIIEVWPLVRSWKADSVALYTLDMVDLAAESCLFTHPTTLAFIWRCVSCRWVNLCPTFNHVLALVFITFLAEISGCLAAKCATMFVDSHLRKFLSAKGHCTVAHLGFICITLVLKWLNDSID